MGIYFIGISQHTKNYFDSIKKTKTVSSRGLTKPIIDKITKRLKVPEDTAKLYNINIASTVGADIERAHRPVTGHDAMLAIYYYEQQRGTMQ